MTWETNVKSFRANNDSELERKLDEICNERWQLVTMLSTNEMHSGATQYKFLFKREKKEHEND